MVKIIKLIRNNWKKSAFAFVTISYGINWGINQYYIETMMRAFCEAAVKYGDTPVHVGKHRRITVILNPAANKRKAKKHFEKYCAPLLYLSGAYVSILETEKEGHAKQLIDKLDPHSDAIVVAGGDGTLSETITGLMRTRGELCRIPIGVLPLGKTNTLANNLFGSCDGNGIYQMAEATMAVIKGNTKPVDALRIEVIDVNNEEQKPVYGLNGIEWGMWHDVKKQQDKLWYFGPLREYASLIFPGHAVEKNISASLRYTRPCSGCSQCYTQRPDLTDNSIPTALNTSRWWGRLTLSHKSTESNSNIKKVDYRHIVNDSCNEVNEKEINTADISLTTSHLPKSEENIPPHLLLVVGPQARNQGQILTDGLKLIKGERVRTIDKVEVKQIEIRPKNEHMLDTLEKEQGKDDSLSIDNEDYEVKPIRVTVLPNSVSVFCP